MEKNSKSIFSRILIIIVIFFIIFIITMSFFKSNPPYTITKNTILCLAILTVLCLSETFDNFSIGKIISLSRNLKNKNIENERLREENHTLINQMINIKNNNNQNISINLEGSKNINDLKGDIDNNDIKEALDEIEKNITNKNSESLLTKIENRRKRINYIRCAEIIAIKNAMEEIPENAEKKYEVKVKDNFTFEDDIISRDIRFDAFAHYNKNDIFYEVKHINFTSIPINNFQLYYMLNLVKKYGVINNTMSKLILIIPLYEEQLETTTVNKNSPDIIINMLEKTFAPAIKNGLLEIKQIKISKEEIEKEMNKQ